MTGGPVDVEEVACARPECGHSYGAHEDGGWCDTWMPPDSLRVFCGCQGFLWVDPAGTSGGYGEARRAADRG